MRTTPVRVTTFVGGVLLSAYMYLLVSATTLGTAPFFVLEEGIAHVTSLPFGVVTATVGLFLLAIAAIMRAPVGPGTFAVPVLFGLSVELLAPLAPAMNGPFGTMLITRASVLVIAVNLLMLGGALIVSASYGASATDAVMLGLASVLHRDVAPVRVVMDLVAAAAGVALGGAAGLGTIVGVLIMGHSFKFWSNRLRVSTVHHRAPRRAGANRRPTPRSFRPSLSMQPFELPSPEPEAIARPGATAQPGAAASCERATTRSPDAHEEVDPFVIVAAGVVGGSLQRQRRRRRFRFGERLPHNVVQRRGPDD